MVIDDNVRRAQATADQAQSNITEHLISCARSTALMQGQIGGLRDDVSKLMHVAGWVGGGLIAGSFSVTASLLYIIARLGGLL